MHSTTHLVNLGKYLLINSMLVDNCYYRAFHNRATGLLGTNNGYRVTALWLLSLDITLAWMESLDGQMTNDHLTPGGHICKHIILKIPTGTS